jgi:ABC-type nitrate/sulfonate/bicarbonate transport system permease component
VTRGLRYALLSGVYVGLLVIWQVIADANAGPQSLFAGPVEIAQTIINRWQSLWEASLVTLSEALAGLALAVLLGLVVAILIDAVNLVGPTVYRLSVILYSVPLIALAPILVLWFGPTFTARAVTAMIASFLPIVINVVQGLRGAPISVSELGESLAMSRFSILLSLRFRYALPAFFASLKIAGPAAFIAAMISEWINAERGLGINLLYAMFSFNVDALWANLVVATFWSGLIYLVFDLVAKKATPWHASAEVAA